MFDVSMIERYWSETIPLRTVPVATVEPTSPALDRLMWARMPEMVASIPLPFMQAPKHIAQMMR